MIDILQKKIYVFVMPPNVVITSSDNNEHVYSHKAVIVTIKY